MRTLLPLEDALEDSPQMRSLLQLFEEDSGNLLKYVGTLRNALKRVTAAQVEMANSVQHLSSVLGAYKVQTFPLDQTEYDMPEVTIRMERAISEVSSWLDVVSQQMTSCVLMPVDKLHAQTESICGKYKNSFHSADNELQEANIRFAKLQRKDQPKKIEEANNDVFFAKRKFHDIALQYYSRLNGIQFIRYTQLIEPMLGYLYAMRSFFHTGTEGLGQEKITHFLTRTQEQMQSIHTEYKEERAQSDDLVQTMTEIQKLDRDLYFAEPLESSGAGRNPAMCQKQGYLYLKSRSGILTRWEYYYLFTQGTNLMCQRPTELAGQVLLDLSTPATSAVYADNEDRRFTFSIKTLSGAVSSGAGAQKSPKTQQLIFQARNADDLWEWVTVVNNLAGNNLTPPETQTPSASGQKTERKRSAALAVPGAEVKSSTTATPMNTPNPSFSMSSNTPEPIQFDILASPGNDSLPKEFEVEDRTDLSFEVRFLGSMDVVTDRGDRLVHETIRQIMTARAVHNIFKMSENKLVIGSHCLRLIDQNNKVVRATFRLSDLAYWTIHADNDRLFAFISRTAKYDSADSSGSDVCHALTEGTRRAFQDLLVKEASDQQTSQSEMDSSEHENSSEA